MTLVATVPEMLVVATNVPAKDIGELIALAKAQPGKLNFASSGPGSLPHLAGELFKLTAKIDIVHVPYRGAAPAVNDLLGQQVQMTFLDLPVLLPQVKAGALRPIAVGSAERSATAPDVPTTAEAGFADLRIENWYGMVAPKGTPKEIVTALHGLATKAMADPAVKEKLAAQGATLVGDRAGAFSQLHRGRDQEVGEGDQGRRRGDGEVISGLVVTPPRGRCVPPHCGGGLGRGVHTGTPSISLLRDSEVAFSWRHPSPPPSPARGEGAQLCAQPQRRLTSQQASTPPQPADAPPASWPGAAAS